MTEVLRLAGWLVVTVAIGWSVLSILFYRKPLLFLPEKIALSYCLGLGLVTIEMAALSVFRINFSISSITIWWLPVFLIGLFLDFKSKKTASPYKDPAGKDGRLSALEKFFIFGISFETCYAFFRALAKPLEAYDAVAIFALKAKAFYMAASIPLDFFKTLSDPVCHPEYPLLLPLAEAGLYTFLGTLNDLLVKIIFPLYFVAALVIFYFMARRFAARKSTLLFTFFLASIPHFNEYATTGYADLVLALYYSASFFYLILGMRERRGQFLALSLLMSILGIWTKTEGLMLALVNMVIAGVYILNDVKALLRKGIAYIAAGMGSILAFLYIKKALGLAIQINMTGIDYGGWARSLFNVRRIPDILYGYQIQFFGPKKWNIIWIIFIAAFILQFKKAFLKDLRPVTLAILLIFAGYTAVYLVTPLDAAWHLSKTANRFFLHFLPLVLLWLAVLFKENKFDI